MFSFFDKTTKSKSSLRAESNSSGKEPSELKASGNDLPSEMIAASKSSSSPRNELKQSVEKLERPKRKVSRNDAEHSSKIQSTSQDIVLPRKENVLNRNRRCLLVNVSSSENDDDPQKSYNLDLDVIESTFIDSSDTSYYGRVKAYFTQNLLRQPISHKSLSNTLPFIDYVKFVTVELNEIQREKYTISRALIEILSPVYAKETRTETNHNKFCMKLLNIIEFCMCTTTQSCFTINSGMGNKTPIEFIKRFWDSALYGLIPSGVEKIKYEQLIGELITKFDQAFCMEEIIKKHMRQHHARSDKELNPCISWVYLHVMCDRYGITFDEFEPFKYIYNKSYFGLTNEFIYVPDMWEFMRQLQATTPDAPYHNILNKIDKMLRCSDDFAEFNPGATSQTSIRERFMGLHM
ncbi:hypothetical protein [uncultured Legionella sp.]|uniref:hypothetical protein n=1 Tax=uncultured Legionella sp. TaxID=210934 RepID=UPI0026316D4A|nr:hypothetical protein [uncultured Legionella sp.]